MSSFCFILLCIKILYTNASEIECECIIDINTDTYISDEIIGPSLQNINNKCSYDIITNEEPGAIAPESVKGCAKAADLFEKTCDILGDNAAIYEIIKDNNNPISYKFHCINNCCINLNLISFEYNEISNIDFNYYKNNPDYDPNTNTVNGLHNKKRKINTDNIENKPKRACQCKEITYYQDKISELKLNVHNIEAKYEEMNDELKPINLPLSTDISHGCFFFDDIIHYVMCIFRTNIKNIELDSLDHLIKYFDRNTLKNIFPYISKKIDFDINDKSQLKQFFGILNGFSKGQTRKFIWKKINMYKLTQKKMEMKEKLESFQNELNWLHKCCKDDNKREL